MGSVDLELTASNFSVASTSSIEFATPTTPPPAAPAPAKPAGPTSFISLRDLVKQVVADPTTADASSSKAPASLQSYLKKPPTTSSVECNVRAFEPYLGKELPGAGGRESVLELAMSGQAQNGAFPRNARGSGTMMWRNALFLFISLGSKYENQFLEGGRQFTWFPSKGGGDGAGVNTTVENSGKAGSKPVLLFVRRQKSPYTYLGRVRRVETDGTTTTPDGRKVFLMELADFDRMAAVDSNPAGDDAN